VFVSGKPFQPSLCNTSLLGQFLSYDENGIVNTAPGDVFTTLRGPNKLQGMFLASLSNLI